jgi:hypothetical protein
MNHNRLVPIEYCQMNAMAGCLPEEFDFRQRFPVEFEICKRDAAEFKQFQSKPIPIPLSVLIQKSDITHRRNEPMRGAFRVSDFVANFGQGQGTTARREALKHATYLAERLDILVRASDRLHFGSCIDAFRTCDPFWPSLLSD